MIDLSSVLNNKKKSQSRINPWTLPLEYERILQGSHTFVKKNFLLFPYLNLLKTKCYIHIAHLLRLRDFVV